MSVGSWNSTTETHLLVLGLVQWIDAKDINVAQSIWSAGCPKSAQKRAKNNEIAFLTVNYPYVGQPDDQISWATSMPFSSIYYTN